MLLLATLLAAGEVPAGRVTLTCSTATTQTQSLTTQDYYKVPPQAEEELYRDAWRYGIMALVAEPSKNLQIDFDAGTVAEMDSGFPPLKIVSIEANRIEAWAATGMGSRRVILNRKTGQVSLIIEGDASQWNRQFGTDLPSYRWWDLKCQRDQMMF
jgi:hypothetical protein